MKKRINLEIPPKFRKKANKLYKKIGLRQNKLNKAALKLSISVAAFDKHLYDLAPDLQGEAFSYTPQTGMISTVPGMMFPPQDECYDEDFNEDDADYNC